MCSSDLGLLTHVVKTVGVTLRNRQARPAAYAVKKPAGGTSRKTLASSTMILSGIWLLLFMVLHVYGFKFAPAPMAVMKAASAAEISRTKTSCPRREINTDCRWVMFTCGTSVTSR